MSGVEWSGVELAFWWWEGELVGLELASHWVSQKVQLTLPYLTLPYLTLFTSLPDLTSP